MKLAIFGATGTVGTELRNQAIATGHDARVLVRTRSKIGSEHPRLTVVAGSAKDKAAVKETVLGCDAVLSTLGATSKDDPDTRRIGTANIMTAMRDAGIRRFIVMGGFHIHCRWDAGNLGQRLIVPLLRLSRNLVEDTTAMGALVMSSDLDWTLVRSPRVVHGHRNGSYRTGILKLGPWSRATSADVASFMLQCLTDNLYIHQAPMVSR